jgi:AcrR family transcriptional regulator
MRAAERKARQKENARQDILDAARDLFVRDGYQSVSMRKIAERVGYAPGTLYLYFQDKAEILDSLCEETFRKLRKRMEAIAGDETDPLDRLRRGLLTYIQFGLDNPDHYTITFILNNNPEAGLESRKCTSGKECFSNLQNIVAQCIETGRAVPGDPAETAQALWAGVHGITSLLIMQCGFPFVEQSRLIERVVNVLIEGIRKR